jgi:hypothetical protein
MAPNSYLKMMYLQTPKQARKYEGLEIEKARIPFHQ